MNPIREPNVSLFIPLVSLLSLNSKTEALSGFCPPFIYFTVRFLFCPDEITKDVYKRQELEMLEDYDVSCKGFQLFYKKSELANETCVEALQDVYKRQM